MRLALTAVLVLHGAIHVLGFLKWARLSPVPQLAGKTLFPLTVLGERAFALGWLVATLLLLGAAALHALRHEAWSTLALTGIALSQLLIVVAWSDARFGTLLNLVLLLPALAGAAHAQFSRSIEREVRTILALGAASPEREVISAAGLQGLPPPVRTWLEASGIVGKRPIERVHLWQRGQLRTAPEAAFMSATAEQYFTVKPPAFVWKVETAMFGFLPISGRDLFAQGRGSMVIKALALKSVVDASGHEIDHGSMLRYLGELVWFPTAALAPYVSWEAIGPMSARATMTYGTLSVSAIFEFGEGGRVIGLHADRYLGGGADAKLTPWVVSCSEWQRFHGIEIPTRGDVGWSLPSGPFTYYRWEILNVEY